MSGATLFEMPRSDKPRLTDLPVSVIDLDARGATSVRGESDHDGQSSRSGFSPFPPQVAQFCCELFLRDATRVVDPFAGWGERGAACVRAGKQYVGFDTSPDAIEHARTEYGVVNTLADAKSAPIPTHDGLLTCPPYWNVERYAGAGLDAAPTWQAFLDGYAAILARCASMAAHGSTYCVVVGDWRAENAYHDLTYQTERVLDSLGFAPFDKVILSRLRTSKVKIMIPQALRLGYTVKVHETLLVYRRLTIAVESATAKSVRGAAQRRQVSVRKG